MSASSSITQEQVNTLHQLKNMRFRKAQEEVVERKNDVQSAQGRLSQAQQATHEFAQFRVQEKKRLTDKVDKSENGVKLDDINILNKQLSNLKQKLMTYQEQEHKAQQALEDAQEALSSAQEVLYKTQRDVSKIDEVRADVMKKYRFEQDKKAEESAADDYSSRANFS